MEESWGLPGSLTDDKDAWKRESQLPGWPVLGRVVFIQVNTRSRADAIERLWRLSLEVRSSSGDRNSRAMDPAPLKRVGSQLATAASDAIAFVLVASLRRLACATAAAPAAAATPATASGLRLGLPVAPPSRRNGLVCRRLRYSWPASAAASRGPLPCRTAAGRNRESDVHAVHSGRQLQVPHPRGMAVMRCG